METDDIGSPGFTAGAVPLRITHQPQDQTVDGGTSATFRVQAVGLPKPRYQWHFNGEPIPDAVSSVRVIPAVASTDAGAYSVVLDNGLASRLSAPAVLQVNTTLSPPSVSVPPVDLIVAPGQTAFFEVLVRGFELPTFQWRFEETDLTDATNRTLTVFHADLASSGTYSVRIQNSLGSTNASARLMVRPKPNLFVTEIMGSRTVGTTLFGRADWWELTSFDTEAVNLRGYQFDDGPGLVAGAVVITNEVIIQPGESVLFIQDMTPEFFIQWWGEENLPENVQFVMYAGNGFSALGDSVTLWNATPLDRSDFIHQVEYLQDLNPDFTPIRGPSRTFWCERFEEFGWPSVVGQCGAVRANASDDVGSPGYITAHPPRVVAPRSLGVSQDEQGVQHTWQTQMGRRYELQHRSDLGGLDWMPISQETATGVLLTTHDPIATGVAQRFYRLVVVSNSP